MMIPARQHPSCTLLSLESGFFSCASFCAAQVLATRNSCGRHRVAIAKSSSSQLVYTLWAILLLYEGFFGWTAKWLVLGNNDTEGCRNKLLRNTEYGAWKYQIRDAITSHGQVLRTCLVSLYLVASVLRNFSAGCHWVGWNIPDGTAPLTHDME